MSETALKFGPEWLRALSHGGSINSPPSSPGPIKFKLADYRYGREEMLALFSKDFKPPDGLENLGSLCIEQLQEPLAFLPMNIDEQRIWQRCVNSEAVLRSAGRIPPNGIGRGRGGSIDRGRGRGRGVAPPYYSRGMSYDEEPEFRGHREGGPPGMSSRTKGFERSQSIGEGRGWPSGPGDRNPPSDRSIPGPHDDHGVSISPQKGRAATGNWRTRGADGQYEADRWKGLTTQSRAETKWGGNRVGWREGEWEEGRGHVSGGVRGSRALWDSERDGGYRRHWDEDNLPEWATESSEDKGGSFDATGAFHAPGSSDEEELTNGEMESPSSPHHGENGGPPPGRSLRNGEENGEMIENTVHWAKEDEIINTESDLKNYKKESERGHVSITQPPPPSCVPLVNGILGEGESHYHPHLISPHTPPSRHKEKPRAHPPPHPHSSNSLMGGGKSSGSAGERALEDENLEHMQSVADDLVAKLVEDFEEDDNEAKKAGVRGGILQPPPGGFVPSSEVLQPPDEQWYYTDPQGDIQGPFTAVDMAAWYKAGYFKPNLLLRRQCDDKFAQLGDLTRVFGRVPFLPGPAVPPLKVSELLNAQKAEAERQRYEMMQAQIIQKQLYQQQTNLRQQQVLQSLQSLDEWRSLSPSQQQQLFVQHMMALPPLVPSTPPGTSSQSAPAVSSAANALPIPPLVQDLLIPSGASSQGSLPSKTDPIQAFVAQMSSNSSSVSVSSDPVPSQAPPQSTSPIGGDGPLQKLLLQLQRGPQGGAGLPQPSSSVNNHSTVEKKNQEPQFDAIQSIMSQLTKMGVHPTHNQDDARQREEEQKRIEEERKLFEEKRRAEEERIKAQELRLEEERIKEEERRKELEVKNKKLEEELKRIQQDQIRRKKEEENKKKEEAKLSESNRKEEEQRRQQQIKQKQKQEEEAKRKAKEEEKRIKLEEEKKRNEEEKKRKEKERKNQLQIQEEMRRVALEEERKRMQQLEKEEKKRQRQEEQLRKAKEAAAAAAAALGPWNNTSAPHEKSPAPSLAEIQKAQEIKERKEREAEIQRENERHKEAQRLAAEERKQKEVASWGSLVASSRGSNAKKSSSKQLPVKSLVEIQKEEAKELKKRMVKEQAERAAAVSHLSLNAAGVWGSAAQSLSWANRASSGATPIPGAAQTGSNLGAPHSWGSAGTPWSAIAQSNDSPNQNSGGFWESSEPPKGNKSSPTTRSPHKTASGGTTNPHTTQNPVIVSSATRNPPAAGGGNNQAVNNSNNIISSNKNKKKPKEDHEGGRRAVAGQSTADSFGHWCKNSLNGMKATASIDVPTFVGFLSDVESPYEVHDYIRSYLGDSKEVKEFAKQYLEKRSRARSAHREGRSIDDNILAPAPAVNPSSSLEFQEVKTRLKRGKKKMQKVDSSILGFSMSSLERVDLDE